MKVLVLESKDRHCLSLPLANIEDQTKNLWAEAVARTKRRQKSEAVERCHCKRRRVRKKRTERERLSGGPAAGDGTGEERASERGIGGRERRLAEADAECPAWGNKRGRESASLVDVNRRD